MPDCSEQNGHTHMTLQVLVCIDGLMAQCAEDGVEPRAIVESFLSDWAKHAADAIVEEINGPED